MKCGDRFTVDGVEMMIEHIETGINPWRVTGIRAARAPDRIVWWFNPVSKMTACHTDDVDLSPDWMEVTPEYAEYLRNNPGEGWELRRPVDGDTIIPCRTDYTHGHPEMLLSGLASLVAEDNGPDGRGYRWCKVKPAAGWREYPVEVRGDTYGIVRNGQWTRGAKLPDKIGYGGVKLRAPNGEVLTWSRSRRAMKDESLPPCVPIAVRFWEGGAE